MPDHIHYDRLPEDEGQPLLNVFDRPEITKKKYNRLRWLIIQILAYVEASDTEGQFTDKIVEIRSLING